MSGQDTRTCTPRELRSGRRRWCGRRKTIFRTINSDILERAYEHAALLSRVPGRRGLPGRQRIPRGEVCAHPNPAALGVIPDSARGGRPDPLYAGGNPAAARSMAAQPEAVVPHVPVPHGNLLVRGVGGVAGGRRRVVYRGRGAGGGV